MIVELQPVALIGARADLEFAGTRQPDRAAMQRHSALSAELGRDAYSEAVSISPWKASRMSISTS
jgi:hypothetical protein